MNVIIDTREKKNIFYFKSYADVDIISRKLDCGDYSVESYEHIVTVDRKATTNELSLNLGAESARFTRELERMRNITFCYFVCSFPYSYVESFPVNSNIPKKRWKGLRITSNYLKRRIKEIEEDYPNVKFIFCNTQGEAEETTYNILKEHTSGR